MVIYLRLHLFPSQKTCKRNMNRSLCAIKKEVIIKAYKGVVLTNKKLHNSH